MKKSYLGGCHCGAVRYEVDLAQNVGTFKCYCSICTKVRNCLESVEPAELLAAAGGNPAPVSSADAR